MKLYCCIAPTSRRRGSVAIPTDTYLVIKCKSIHELSLLHYNMHVHIMYQMTYLRKNHKRRRRQPDERSNSERHPLSDPTKTILGCRIRQSLIIQAQLSARQSTFHHSELHMEIRILSPEKEVNQVSIKSIKTCAVNYKLIKFCTQHAILMTSIT